MKQPGEESSGLPSGWTDHERVESHPVDFASHGRSVKSTAAAHAALCGAADADVPAVHGGVCAVPLVRSALPLLLGGLFDCSAPGGRACGRPSLPGELGRAARSRRPPARVPPAARPKDRDASQSQAELGCVTRACASRDGGHGARRDDDSLGGAHPCRRCGCRSSR
jgi:hypothetical protein